MTRPDLSEKLPSVGSKSLGYGGDIPWGGGPNDPQVLCCIRKRDSLTIQEDWIDHIGVIDKMIFGIFCEGKKSSFFRNKLDLVLIAVLNGEEKKIIEVVNIIGQEHFIVIVIGN